MNIQIHNSPLHVNAGSVGFVLQDFGSANVTLMLTIENVATIHHVEPDKGGTMKMLDLAPGTYRCYLTIIAYKYGALGPIYDAHVAVNNTEVATASGVVPQADPSDDDDASFVVVAN